MLTSISFIEKIHFDIKANLINKQPSRELKWSCDSVLHSKIDEFAEKHLSDYIYSREYKVVTVSKLGYWKVSSVGRAFFAEESCYHMHDPTGVFSVGKSEISDFTLGRTVLQITTSIGVTTEKVEDIVSRFEELFMGGVTQLYEWRYEKIQNCKKMDQVVGILMDKGLIINIHEPYIVLDGGMISTRQSIGVQQSDEPWVEIMMSKDWEGVKETFDRFQEELLTVLQQGPAIKKYAFDISKLQPEQYEAFFRELSTLEYRVSLDVPFVDVESPTSDRKVYKQYLMIDLT